MSKDENSNHFPSDKEFYEQSMIYLTDVFFNAYPSTPIDTICELAQNHLDLFKQIYDTLNQRPNDDSSESTESTDESIIESPTLIKKSITIYENHFEKNKECYKNIRKEIKLRPPNPRRSPSKFSKDSNEYKQFVKHYSQKLRDRNLDPKERSIKVNDKWNSMNTEKVLKYLRKHNKENE